MLGVGEDMCVGGWLVGLGIEGCGVYDGSIFLEMVRTKSEEMRVIIYFRRTRAMKFDYFMRLTGFSEHFAMWHGGWGVLWYCGS
jgi:hypothetical protein